MQASWSQCRTFLPQRHSPQFRLHLPAAEPIIVTSLILLCCKSTSAGSFHGFLSDLQRSALLRPRHQSLLPCCQVPAKKLYSCCGSALSLCFQLRRLQKNFCLSQGSSSELHPPAIGWLSQEARRWIGLSVHDFTSMNLFLNSGNSIRTSTLFSCLRSQMHKAKASSWCNFCYTLLHPSAPHILRV